MEKVLVPEGAEKTMTLSDILTPFEVQDDASFQVGGGQSDTINTIVEAAESKNSPLSGLGLKHGSLITVKNNISTSTTPKPTESRFSQLKVQKDAHSWDPFPDLAKDYEHALLKTKTRRSSNKSMSYSDIARLQSSLHIVEPQPEGPLKRVYMCHKSAERFQTNGIVGVKQRNKAKTTQNGAAPGLLPRVGLLLGTIQTERVEKTPRKARTSLSSQTSDADFCAVTKVQAIYEPPNQKITTETNVYDASLGQTLLQQNPRVLVLAEHLGLLPVGWIFSYQDERHKDEEALPVFGLDIQTGAKLQIDNMRSRGHSEGAKFVTLAMDAKTGATEAFQLSDVSVQMVHEGMLVASVGKSGRQVYTKHGVVVDGKEMKELDSVLCLVNTAMLSHVGSYAGNTAASSVKKNGSLTTKTKKALLSALKEDDRRLLEELCDFNTLLALDQSLSNKDTEEWCQLVRKWARGQKEGTQVNSKLKMRLQGVLES
jgi:hypothetical protein